MTAGNLKALKEFIIGLQPSPVQLTDNSDLHELILITERTNTVEIVPGTCDGDEIVSAILFNDGDIVLRVRDNGSPREGSSKSLLQLSTPFVKHISMQQTCYSAHDQPHLYWRRITYLRIESYDGNVVEVGKLFSKSSDGGNNGRCILPEECVEGPCMITGVGMHNTDIICLQIISGSALDMNKNPDQIEEHLATVKAEFNLQHLCMLSIPVWSWPLCRGKAALGGCLQRRSQLPTSCTIIIQRKQSTKRNW